MRDLYNIKFYNNLLSTSYLLRRYHYVKYVNYNLYLNSKKNDINNIKLSMNFVFPIENSFLINYSTDVSFKILYFISNQKPQIRSIKELYIKNKKHIVFCCSVILNNKFLVFFFLFYFFNVYKKYFNYSLIDDQYSFNKKLNSLYITDISNLKIFNKYLYRLNIRNFKHNISLKIDKSKKINQLIPVLWNI